MARFHSHTRERLIERGAAEEEVIDLKTRPGLGESCIAHARAGFNLAHRKGVFRLGVKRITE